MGKGTPSDNYPAMPGMVGRQGTAHFIFVKCFVRRMACWARDDHSCPRPRGPVVATPSLLLWSFVLVQPAALQLLMEESKKQRG